MKHLILGGGYLHKASDGGKRWVEALLARTGSEARIAFCLFARDEHEWVEVMQKQEAIIRQFAGDTKLTFKTITLANCAEVSDWANVIYVTGGDFPARLRDMLGQRGDALMLWDEKTICGSSAGADVMGLRYMHLQTKKAEEGLGWIAANVIPHWRAPDWPDWDKADWDAAARELANPSGKAPLLCLREGEFVEIEVS